MQFAKDLLFRVAIVTKYLTELYKICVLNGHLQFLQHFTKG